MRKVLSSKIVICVGVAIIAFCIYQNIPTKPNIIDRLAPEFMAVARDYLLEDYADIREKKLRVRDAGLEREKAERDFEGRISRISHVRKTFNHNISPTAREQLAIENFIKGEYRFANLSEDDIEVLSQYYFRDENLGSTSTNEDER